MNEQPVSIESAEQDLAKARALMQAKYHAIEGRYRAMEAKLRRSAKSPLLVGGVFLGAAALA